MTATMRSVILGKAVYMTKILQKSQKVNFFLNNSKLFMTQFHLYTVSGRTGKTEADLLPLKDNERYPAAGIET